MHAHAPTTRRLQQAVRRRGEVQPQLRPAAARCPAAERAAQRQPTGRTLALLRVAGVRGPGGQGERRRRPPRQLRRVQRAGGAAPRRNDGQDLAEGGEVVLIRPRMLR